MGAKGRRLLVVAVMSAGLLMVGGVDLAGAQTMTVETIPPEVDESGRTAGDRVDEVVLTLRILAGVVLAGTVAFWWYTRPARSAPVDDPEDGTVDQEVTPEKASA